MDSIEVARKITFDDPASPRVTAILKLQFHGPDSMMHAAFRSEPVGETMEVALPYRVHNHQHGALDDAVCQRRNTQRAQPAIRFRDIDAPDRLRAVCAVQQVHTQVCQMLIQRDLHALLVYSVYTRRMGATRRQYDPGGFGKPLPTGHEPQ